MRISDSMCIDVIVCPVNCLTRTLYYSMSNLTNVEYRCRAGWAEQCPEGANNYRMAQNIRGASFSLISWVSNPTRKLNPRNFFSEYLNLLSHSIGSISVISNPTRTLRPRKLFFNYCYNVQRLKVWRSYSTNIVQQNAFRGLSTKVSASNISCYTVYIHSPLTIWLS